MADRPTLATSVAGFRESSLGHYLDALQAADIHAAEIGFSKTSERTQLWPGMTPDDLRDVAASLERARVTPYSLSIANDFTVRDREQLEREIALVRESIDAADALGAKVIKVYAGTFPMFDLGLDPEWMPLPHFNFYRLPRLPEPVLQQVVEAFGDVVTYAAQRGITLAIENHDNMSATASQILAVLQRVNQPNLGVVYDPANFLMLGEDPLEMLAPLLPHITYVHAKDCVLLPNSLVRFGRRLGEGVIQWPMIIEQLQNYGYYGAYAVEHLWLMDAREATVHGARYLRGLLGL